MNDTTEIERIAREPGRIIVTPEREIARPLGRLTDNIVEQVAEQAELFRRVKVAVLKATNDNDWLDIEGSPYLTDSGVHNVASCAGVEFGSPVTVEDKGKDERGEYVNFTCELKGTWLHTGRTHSDVGTSSTRDPFFSKSRGAEIPLSGIVLGNVRKKAITNAQHRVLEKLLGIGGLSWDQLKEQGIRVASQAVRFKGSEAKVATGQGGWTPEKSRLWGILLTITGGSVEEAAEILYKETHKPGQFEGKRDPAQLTDKAAAYWLKQFEQRYQAQNGEAFKGAGAPQPGADVKKET